MRIAADDVGAGNAGLRLLSEIRFDIVKIDLSLVQGGVLRDSALAVLGVLCDVADRSGAVVVAEGVETPEQLATVRALGLASGQGYLLARPDKTTSARVLDLDALAIREDPSILALAVPTGRAAPTRVPGAA
jgi:EAL domain-containing protein (putative c-di-GMP-specific phosphodiesterase class I)